MCVRRICDGPAYKRLGTRPVKVPRAKRIRTPARVQAIGLLSAPGHLPCRRNGSAASRLIPAPATVPTAAEQQHEHEDDNQQCRRIHGEPRICEIDPINASCAPFVPDNAVGRSLLGGFRPRFTLFSARWDRIPQLQATELYHGKRPARIDETLGRFIAIRGDILLASRCYGPGKPLGLDAGCQRRVRPARRQGIFKLALRDDYRDAGARSGVARE